MTGLICNKQFAINKSAINNNLGSQKADRAARTAFLVRRALAKAGTTGKIGKAEITWFNSQLTQGCTMAQFAIDNPNKQ